MRCLSCKYDLSHLTEHRCPECGRQLNPNDRNTFDDAKLRHKRFDARTIDGLISLVACLAFRFAALSETSRGYWNWAWWMIHLLPPTCVLFALLALRDWRIRILPLCAIAVLVFS